MPNTQCEINANIEGGKRRQSYANSSSCMHAFHYLALVVQKRLSMQKGFLLYACTRHWVVVVMGVVYAHVYMYVCV